MDEEKRGEILMFFEAFAYALFPIFVRSSSGFLPPVLFAGGSMFLAGIITLIFLAYQGKISELFHRQALPYMAAGTFFIVIIFYNIMFIAGQKTTAGNLGILQQTEVFWTFLFFGLLGLEKITKKRILGGVLIFLGTIFILAKSFSGTIQVWDILIVLATIIPSFGNFFQKKAVRMVSPIAHLCFRSLWGGGILLFGGLFWGTVDFDILFSQKSIFLIFLNGVVVFGIAKICFLEAMKRIDVSKAIALNSAAPALTLVIAFFFLNEVPTVEQISGLLVMIIGIFLLIDRRHESIITA